MFVDSLTKYIGPSHLYSLLSAELFNKYWSRSLISFEDVSIMVFVLWSSPNPTHTNQM